MAPGGTLAIVTEPHVKDEDDKKVLMVFGVFYLPQHRALGAEFSIALTRWLEEGTIKVRRRVNVVDATADVGSGSPTRSRCFREG